MAHLPAHNQYTVTGASYLELANYFSGSSKQKPAGAIDPNSEDFDLLAALASLGSAVLPSLREATNDNEPSVSKTAHSILERIALSPNDSFARLIPLLESPDPSLRRQTAQNIANAPDAVGTPLVLAALKKALKDKVMSVRAAVAVALTRVDPTNTNGVDAMIAELQDPANRVAAAYALADMGERAASAGDSLLKLLMSNATAEQTAAISALGNIGASVVPKLVILLDAKNRQHSMAASVVLVEIGKPSVQPVIDRLSRIQDSKDPAFTSVIGVLIQLGAQSVPSLIENLKYSHEPRALWSAFALGQIGPSAWLAIPALSTAARSTNLGLSREATEALKKIQIR